MFVRPWNKKWKLSMEKSVFTFNRLAGKSVNGTVKLNDAKNMENVPAIECTFRLNLIPSLRNSGKLSVIVRKRITIKLNRFFFFSYFNLSARTFLAIGSNVVEANGENAMYQIRWWGGWLSKNSFGLARTCNKIE